MNVKLAPQQTQLNELALLTQKVGQRAIVSEIRRLDEKVLDTIVVSQRSALISRRRRRRDDIGDGERARHRLAEAHTERANLCVLS